MQCHIHDCDRGTLRMPKAKLFLARARSILRYPVAGILEIGNSIMNQSAKSYAITRRGSITCAGLSVSEGFEHIQFLLGYCFPGFCY